MKNLSWRRIPSALRYFRAHGPVATWRSAIGRTIACVAWRRAIGGAGTYAAWLRAYDTLRPADTTAILRHIAEFSRRPLISVILAGDGHTEASTKAANTVIAQLYPHWELVISMSRPVDVLRSELEGVVQTDPRIKLVQVHASDGWASLANAAIASARGEFILFLDEDDQLAPHAIYCLVSEICKADKPDIVYSDEDEIDAGGNRCFPKFKTDWNPDLLRSYNYLGRLTAYRRELLAQTGRVASDLAGAEEYDLNLRLTEKISAPHIRHIPMILYHRCKRDGDAATGSAVRAVERHLARAGAVAKAVTLTSGHVRAQYHLPSPLPGVSLIVPTRDRVGLLRECIDGLLSNTDYGNLKIIIVDNDSLLPETHEYLMEINKEARVRVLQVSGPFNYSLINNCAAKLAESDIIGFINSDIKVIHPHWLREMVSQVLRPEIGAVGAKLFYPNDTIQHAGTIVGLGGLAGHAFRHFNRDDAGYLHRLSLTQNMSAVTAACMLMRKHVFEEVGGFDEINLPVAYSDVDICLKISESGYLNIWTPFAQLYHLESGSRPSDHSRERIEQYKREMKYLRSRWKHVIQRDPFYNPNLTNEAEDFSLAFPPRVVRPWQ